MLPLPSGLMIFAAGFGTRMRPLTLERPKPLIAVGGRALIDHTLDIARAAGAGPIAVNLHYKAGMLTRHLAGHGLHLIEERPVILDTGGGLKNALPVLGDGPVFTLNSDVIWQGPNPLECLAASWDPEEMDALLLGIPPERALGHGASMGDFTRDQGGRLRRGPGLVYGGAQITTTAILAGIAEPAFSLNRVWDIFAKHGRLFGLPYPGLWCDVGTPAGLPLAERLVGSAP